MLTNEQVLDILKEKDAVLEGHFLLTSGRHSDRYVQCAKLFQYADTSAKICESLAEGLKDMDIDAVVSPAVGGILMGYEMGRQLGVRNIFTERVEGKMALRRGFTVAQGEKLLVVEDVVTTGGSVKEVIALMRELGSEIVGVASVVPLCGKGRLRRTVQGGAFDGSCLLRTGGMRALQSGQQTCKTRQQKH